MTHINSTVYLSFISRCQIEEKIYFINLTFNGLFYLDIENMSIHFVHQFTFVDADTINLSMTNGTVFYEDALYFFPSNTNVIMKYNISQQREQMISIPFWGEEPFMAVDTVRRRNLIYMFPWDLGKGIYIFDMEKQKVEKDRELSLLFEPETHVLRGVSTTENCVSLAIDGSNQIVEIDLEAKKIIYTKIFEKQIQINDFFFDGENYWIITKNSTAIYEWNKEKDTIETYINPYMAWEDDGAVAYANMIFLKNDILVLSSSWYSGIFYINKEKKTIENSIMFSKGLRLGDRRFRYEFSFYQYDVLENQIILYPYGGSKLLIYNKDTGEVSEKEMQIPDEAIPYLRKALQTRFRRKKRWNERTNWGTLEQFIDYIVMNENITAMLKYGNIGKLVYQYQKE